MALRMCKNSIIVLPITILMLWHAGFLDSAVVCLYCYYNGWSSTTIFCFTCRIINFIDVLCKKYIVDVLVVHPEIVTEVSDSITNETYPAVVTCQATGEPAPNISWYFNGVMIDVSDTSKYMIMSTSINTTTEDKLTVYNITSSDVGTYTCNATNIIGRSLVGDVQSSGILTVNGKLFV